MITANGVRRYCNAVHAAGTVYVWGMDGEIITEEAIETLKKRFGADHYKLLDVKAIEGKPGADCSGMITNISGKNSTAAAYYDSCKTRGPINKMPKNKVCLIFRKENDKIVHIGVYTGDGRLTEMFNGCNQREFKESQWTYYGIPDWIIQEKELEAGDKVTLSVNTRGYLSSSDAISGNHMRVMVAPGEYYVYKTVQGSINISKRKDSPGSWIRWP